MKIELHFHIKDQPVRVKELSGDSARFIPFVSDRVILDGEVFSVTRRTLDLDKDSWTVVLFRERESYAITGVFGSGKPSEPVY